MIRTRIAPSPTGQDIHIGNLYTAYINWAFAKKNNGKFIIRIEDTDRTRYVEGAEEKILSTLQAYGLTHDESVDIGGAFAPYRQSERLPIYKKYANQLIESGHAYYCICSPERLSEVRKQMTDKKQIPRYDKYCLDKQNEVKKKIEAGEKWVVRLNVPENTDVIFEDIIRGEIKINTSNIDDQVLLKSDGFPTYHLAHVVDDRLMKTDMVIRGEEWLSSLPKHLILFKAFGWEAPKYAHVPLLLNKDRTKLSKRQNDVAAEDYIKKGYLPEALLNFLALLGWNPGTEQELFSVPELVQAFSLERVQKSGAVFDLEKLDWLQGQWMRKIPVEEFASRILPLVTEKYPAAANDPQFLKRAALIQERITFFPEAPEMLGYFYAAVSPTMALVASPKQKIEPSQVPTVLDFLKTQLGLVSEADWNRDSIVAAIEKALPESGFKKGQILWPLRAMLTGREYSPGAYEVAELLGKEETMRRLERELSR